MANETKKTPPAPKELSFNALVPKKESLDAYARKIIKERDPAALSSLINEFRAMTLKKEVIRMVKLSEFLDLADEEVGKRLSEHPERLKNSEVVEFSKILQDSIDRSNKQIDMIQEEAIKIPSSTSVNVTKNEVNVNLNTASREKITGIVMSILKSGAINKDTPVQPTIDEPVDVTPVEEVAATVESIDSEEVYFARKEGED